MREANATGRVNQRLRTRQDLLHAAGRLLKQGRTPTMEEVAAEAMVSRATAYRYFPNPETLMTEAPLDGDMPNPGKFFEGDDSNDPAERLDRAEAMLHDLLYRNETRVRLVLAESLSPSSRRSDGQAAPPLRQNRRGPLIEEALAPARKRFSKLSYENLCAALSLIFGSESFLVFRDVLPLDKSVARRVKSWAIRALVRAALVDSATTVKGQSLSNKKRRKN